MTDVFISHVEEDVAIALGLAQCFERGGFTTWYYERDGVPGVSYLLQTGRAIGESRAFLLLISLNSLSSHQITKEVVRAHEAGKPFLPVLVDISHPEFQVRQPEWREAIGAAASVQLGNADLQSVCKSLIRGLTELLGTATAPNVPTSSEPSQIGASVASSANQFDGLGTTVLTFWWPDGQGGAHEASLPVAWSEVLTTIGPVMLHPCNELTISAELCRSIGVREYNGAAFLDLKRSDLRSVLTVLYSAGVVEPSGSLRMDLIPDPHDRSTIPERYNYWQLTSAGRTQLKLLLGTRAAG
jgi:hypothetical protein